MENPIDSLLDDLESLGISQFEEALDFRGNFGKDQLEELRKYIKEFRTKDNLRIIKIEGRYPKDKFINYNNINLVLTLCNKSKIVFKKKEVSLPSARYNNITKFSIISYFEIFFYNYNRDSIKIEEDSKIFELEKEEIARWRLKQIGLMNSIRDYIYYSIALIIIDKLSINIKELSWYSPWDNKRIYMDNK